MCFTDPRWKCAVCYSGGNEGSHCDECHATRDGVETQECTSCGRYRTLDQFTQGTSACDVCLEDCDQDLRFHTETEGRFAA